jgi:ribonucleoside-diphosphate reductase alpha chain
VLRIPSPVPPAQRLSEVVDQLAGIGGGRQLGFGRNRVRSLPDAVAQTLAEFLGGMEAANEAPSAVLEEPHAAAAAPNGVANLNANGVIANGTVRTLKADLCPECGDTTLVYEEGCKKCYSCGYSEC